MYNTIIHLLYIVLCVPQPKSSLLPSLFMPLNTILPHPTSLSLWLGLGEFCKIPNCDAPFVAAGGNELALRIEWSHKILLHLEKRINYWVLTGQVKVDMVNKFFFKDFIYLFFREKGKQGEREGEKHQCVVASCVPPTGDLARNPGMCLHRESNQWLFGSKACIQSTELHQPGLVNKFLIQFFMLKGTLPHCSSRKYD